MLCYLMHFPTARLFSIPWVCYLLNTPGSFGAGGKEHSRGCSSECFKLSIFAIGWAQSSSPKDPQSMGIEDFANPSSSEEVLHSGGYSPNSLIHPWSLSNEEGVRTNSPGCDATGNVHLGRSAGEANGLIPFTTGTKSALPNEPPRYPF